MFLGYTHHRIPTSMPVYGVSTLQLALRDIFGYTGALSYAIERIKDKIFEIQSSLKLGKELKVWKVISIYLSCMHPLTLSLQWRLNKRRDVSNHQPHDCLLNRLFRRRLRKTWKLRVTGLCAGNSTVIDEFPAQRASGAENVSIWCAWHSTNMCFTTIWNRSMAISPFSRDRFTVFIRFNKNARTSN